MGTVRWRDAGGTFTPGKIVCVGQNYVAHIEELGSIPAGHPLLFTKPASSLVSPPDPIVLPAFSDDVHHEVELTLVIGRRCKHLRPQQVDQVIAGYALGLDLTARDVQSMAKSKGHPWAEALAFTSIADLEALRLRLWVGQELRQDGETSLMIYKLRRLVCDASRFFTLEPGDLLMTGTPHGVARLRAGDRVVAALSDPSATRLEVAFDVVAEDPDAQLVDSGVTAP
jgi:2-keto-4-pentenoate hydratase/2-oxohepta-3-ene-1,7-dioic acid hydratase in catechol pathway